MMTTSRFSLIVSIAFILLVACSNPTPTTTLPTATPPAQAATSVPTAAGTPVAAVPTATAPAAATLPATATPQPAFAQGITTDPLAVVNTAPKDKGEGIVVSKDQTKIIVQFNHPVVPLVSVDAQKDLPQPLTISPNVSGAGEWLNTSTYAFTLAQNLAVATGYTVSVASLKDMLGQSLSGYSWSFKTTAPVILKTFPEDNTQYASVSEPISMTFNAEMDRASTEANFTLIPVGRPGVAGTPVPGKFEWQGPLLKFIPANSLDNNTQYQANLKAGAQDTNRVASTSSDRTWTFRTVNKPGVSKTLPVDGDQSAKSIRSGFQINFNSPMASNAVTVTVNPTITNQSQYWEYGMSNTRLTVNGGWLASRSYTVTISAESQTRYGEKLGSDVVVHFTAAPLDPALSLNVNGSMGMYDTNVPQVIYAAYTNLNRMDYALYALGRQDFLKLTGSDRYRYLDSFTPDKASQLRTWSLNVKAPLNASGVVSTTLSVGATGAPPLPPGAYYLLVSSPEITNDKPARYLLTVTGSNLALKRTETEALVWATGLATGKPVANQPLDLYGATGIKIASGTTDADGVLRVKFDRQSPWDPLYVLSEADGKIVAAAGSDWSDGINVYDFNMPVNAQAQDFYANLYTDRAIYRPGQTVFFKGILRRDNDAAYSLPTGVQTVPMLVRDDQGKEVFRQDIPLSQLGTFNGQFDLSPSASIGYYNLSFELGTDPNRFVSSVGFQVAEYKAPEFQVDVKTDKPEYVNGDTIKVDVTSAYFFGGPVANAQVTWRLLSDDLVFSTDKVKGWWDFADYDLTNGVRRAGGVIRDGKGITDAQGKFHFEAPADLKDFPLSQNFTLDVEIVDINNQSVSNRATAPVHKGNYYIGLRPQRYVGAAGEEQSADIVTVDTHGDPSPNQSLTLSFFQHEWYSVQQKREDGNFYWTSAYTDTLVSKMDVKTDSTGAATAKYTPPSGGVYKIVGEGVDAAGNKIRSATYQWVTGSGYINWRVENNDRIDLVADKKSYNVGDTAEILIPAPFKASEALLTIERGTIREVKRLTLPGNSETVKIPIQSDYTPNVFVSIMLVKGRSSDSPSPQFKLGYTNLAVSTAEKEIGIKITPDRAAPSASTLPQYGPGDKAGFTIQATDYTGKPVQAEFSLALVDKAVQSLASDTSQSPLDAFYGQRGLGVMTSASLAKSVERLNQQLEAAHKGGGGGAFQQEPVRRNFQDTAFWKADVLTDAQGRVSISIPLPDNLTTWNLTAKGVTGADTLVGLATTDIMSTKPLLIRPVAPRFFVVGDKAHLEAVVNNNTDQDITADVRLDAQGLTLSGSSQQSLTIKAHDKAKVGWDTTVNPVEQAVVKFSATGGQFQDALEQTLPVLRPISPETVATAGQVEGKTAEQIQLPAQVDPTAGELRVDLAPSLAAASNAALDYLRAYGYECSEQTVSRFFPNIVTYLALKKLGIDRPDLKKNLENNVSAQVQRLYSLQNKDGGWGWWADDASNPNLTAYALYALYTARLADLPVDSQVLGRARDFLTQYLNGPVDVKVAPYGYNERAFVLFVLGETGSVQSGSLVSLYDKRTYLDNYGKAYLLMAMQRANQSQVDALSAELASAAIQSATGSHWEEQRVDFWTMNTNTRSTAIIVMALSRATTLSGKTGAPSATLANAVRWLMVARKEGHWATTQETAWSVLGLTEFMLSTGELNGAYSYQVTVNGKPLGDGTVDKSNIDQTKTLTVAIKDLVTTSANDLSIARDNNSGQLYYSAYLRYYLPVDKMQPMSRGIIVGRQYYAVDSQTLKPTDKPLSSARVGDYVQVRLTLIAPTDLHYLVMEDPLPAGFEAVDTTLKTSTAAAQGPELQKQNPQVQAANNYDSFYQPYWNYWAHSEVHDDRVAVFATYLGRGAYEYTYMMRASVGGEFRALPTNAYEMYFPEVFGRSAGALFSIGQ
ncbi:MAG: Ig-like domain-containing protein [Anaerolineae bacterium]